MMIKCDGCETEFDETIQYTVPELRRGMMRYKPFFGLTFCWQCYYAELMKRGLYHGQNKYTDIKIYQQFNRLESRALARMQPNAHYEKVRLWELMQLVAKHDYRCALTGYIQHLTFDHIHPIADGGGHFLENLRPVASIVNLLESAIYFGQMDENDKRIFYSEQRKIYMENNPHIKRIYDTAALVRELF